MLNRVILRGYVADEPFIRATEGGKLARLRMVTIEKIKSHKSGVLRHHTEWHTITLWGERADLADDKIRIGAAIEVEGALRTREWDDKEGVTRKLTEISASRIELLNGIDGYTIPDYIQKNITIKHPTTPSKMEVTPPADDPDDLPF